MIPISRRERTVPVTTGRGRRLLDRLRRRRPTGSLRDWLIRVDEFRDGDALVKAEIPGIDPAKDVRITVADGILRIKAERRLESNRERAGYTRRELRYGSMMRALRLPENVAEDDISASYKHGILEIRVPVAPAPQPSEPVTIPVTAA
jgi:HSP20 family protein